MNKIKGSALNVMLKMLFGIKNTGFSFTYVHQQEAPYLHFAKLHNRYYITPQRFILFIYSAKKSARKILRFLKYLLMLNE